MADLILCSQDGCSNKVHAQDLCKNHYRLARNRGLISARKTKAQWLIEHVNWKGEECLYWPYPYAVDGYGRITFKRQGHVASRFMCELAHGSPPEDELDAAHSCGNGKRGCLNPRHLRWASRSENNMDKVEHGTSMRGRRNHTNVLSEASVRRIRALAGTASEPTIAKEFGVSRSLIGMIVRRERWGWLD